MLKKIISVILIIIWIYFILIFAKPWTTDFIESHFWSKFSVKVRALKQVLDWKKTFSEFKKFIWEDNPNVAKYFDTIDSWISWVKGSIDSIRKKALDTKKWFDENVEMIEGWIKKVKETKEKIEKITSILKDEDIENPASDLSSTGNVENKNLEIEDKIDEEIKKDTIEKNSTKKTEKIYYNPMWDINDF